MGGWVGDWVMGPACAAPLRFYEPWAAYISMEHGLRHLREARALYRRCYSRKLEENRQLQLCVEWLRFEHEEGRCVCVYWVGHCPTGRQALGPICQQSISLSSEAWESISLSASHLCWLVTGPLLCLAL